MIHLHHAVAQCPERASAYFDLEDHDLFFAGDVNTLLYGQAWESLLIEDGSNAIVHAFVRSPISNTGLFDIEPLVGYSGLLANTTQTGFLQMALAEYSAFCRQRGIVAELLRFNPMLRNHEPLNGHFPGLRVVEQKPIAYLRLMPNPEPMLSSYTQKCRNMVRSGMRRFQTQLLDKFSPDWDAFLGLYRRSMRAARANPAWLFDDAFFARLRDSKRSFLVGTLYDGNVVTVSVFLTGVRVGYYFLSTSNHEIHRRAGASNSNVHFAAIQMGVRGGTWLCLGGGNSDAPDDPLMRFKASFGSEIRQLPLGFFSHDRDKLSELYAMAEAECDDTKKSSLFLRYRLAPSLSRGRMGPLAPSAAPLP